MLFFKCLVSGVRSLGTEPLKDQDDIRLFVDHPKVEVLDDHVNELWRKIEDMCHAWYLMMKDDTCD